MNLVKPLNESLNPQLEDEKNPDPYFQLGCVLIGRYRCRKPKIDKIPEVTLIALFKRKLSLIMHFLLLQRKSATCHQTPTLNVRTTGGMKLKLSQFV